MAASKLPAAKTLSFQAQVHSNATTAKKKTARWGAATMGILASELKVSSCQQDCFLGAHFPHTFRWQRRKTRVPGPQERTRFRRNGLFQLHFMERTDHRVLLQ